MSCFGGPEIQNEYLIGYWDANNPRSYSGSGTSWVNIVNRTSATLVGSPTYSSNGYIMFDGINDCATIPSISESIKTVITWVRPTAISGNYIIFCPDSNGADNWLGISNNKLELFFTRITDVNNTFLYGSTNISTNAWYQIACTIDTNTLKLYLNGVEDGSRTVAFTIGAWNTTSAIGRRGILSQRFFTGDVASVSIYNSVFTENGIRQNFNAMRGRFGI